MRQVLVFGGSGQIGRPLLARLRRDGWRVFALSRERRADEPGLHWLAGDFTQSDPLPRRIDAVISCGPLDLFSHWLEQAELDCRRVIAFGSTSMATKRESASAAERELAARLHAAEARVFARAGELGIAATLLRPTLVYGAGRDATLTRIAGLAQRWRCFPLPRGAIGLRQPVHVDDLAAAAHACLSSPASHGRAYDLPGGETLPYREMAARVLAVLKPRPRLIELPSPVFRLAVAAAQVSGRAQGLDLQAVARMRSDLVFDAAPAQRDLGYAPRMFRPTPEMFEP
ncbi:NAD-dependent epimerase/dehydratase family protein [Lysobacter korlensis]|uniref:NAD-dependent epimerase/dehydratase family protein n=1 Tax=Lysobacter korlensis TaxID=553636 RepID=A0ABV6RIL4_9GAMM